MKDEYPHPSMDQAPKWQQDKAKRGQRYKEGKRTSSLLRFVAVAGVAALWQSPQREVEAAVVCRSSTRINRRAPGPAAGRGQAYYHLPYIGRGRRGLISAHVLSPSSSSADSTTRRSKRHDDRPLHASFSSSKAPTPVRTAPASSLSLPSALSSSTTSFAWLHTHRGGGAPGDHFSDLFTSDTDEGSLDRDSSISSDSDDEDDNNRQRERVRFQVKTECGFKDLDQKLDLTVEGKVTVAELKKLIQEQMPGHPPATLQRLFHSGRKLKDDETIADIFEDSILPLPILLDMPPPVEQLDYEAMLQLKVRYNALENKQPLFYAANAVGLKYAIQALDEHLLKRPRPGQVVKAAEDVDLFDTEDDDEEEDDNDEGEEEPRTRLMKEEIASLKDYLKTHEKEVPPPQPIQPEANAVAGVIRELGIPGLEAVVKTLALQLNIDWKRSFRYSFAAYLFGKYGAQEPWNRILLALVPGIFLLQLRAFRYGAKVLWEMMAVSPLVGGFSSALLSAPQQVLLTFDDAEYLVKLYGEKDLPPPIGAPLEVPDGEEEEEEEEEEEGSVMEEEEDDDEEQGSVMEEEEDDEEEDLDADDEVSMSTRSGSGEEEDEWDEEEEEEDADLELDEEEEEEYSDEEEDEDEDEED